MNSMWFISVTTAFLFIQKTALCLGMHQDPVDSGSASPVSPGVNCPGQCSCERTPAKVIVDCSYRQLTSLPDLSVLQHENLPLDVRLDGNSFPHVLGTSLWYVGARLRSLYITNNQRVFNIGERAFSQPHYNIKILRLSPIHNDLEYNLKTILSSNTLEKVYVETRSSLPIALESPLTDGISNLQLKVLHLYDCGVSKLGHMAVAGLTLRELGLSKNLLPSFPIVLWYMMAETLEVLYLDQNRITALKKSQFPKTCKLRKLFLQSNLISVIQEDTLDNCQKLEVINLAGNIRLNTLDSSLFVHLDNLKLDLRSTGISRFDFVASFQIKFLLAYNEDSFCNCKEAFPYLLKFGSKLKAICQNPDSKEKKSIHDVCADALSAIEDNDDDDEIVHGLKKQPVYSYETVDHPAQIWAEGGLIKLFWDMFDLKRTNTPMRTRTRDITEDGQDLGSEDDLKDLFSFSGDFGDIDDIDGQLEEPKIKQSVGTESKPIIDTGEVTSSSDGGLRHDTTPNESLTINFDLDMNDMTLKQNVDKMKETDRELVDENVDNVDTENVQLNKYSSQKFYNDINHDVRNKGIEESKHSGNYEEINPTSKNLGNPELSVNNLNGEEKLQPGVRNIVDVPREKPAHNYDSKLKLNSESMTESIMSNKDDIDEKKELNFGINKQVRSKNAESSFVNENTNGAVFNDGDFSTCFQSCLKHISHTGHDQWESKRRKTLQNGAEQIKNEHIGPCDTFEQSTETGFKAAIAEKRVEREVAQDAEDSWLKKNSTCSADTVLSRAVCDLPLFACIVLLFLTYMTHDKLSRMSRFIDVDYLLWIYLYEYY